MDDRTRLDSATALARTPLFSHLGRLDLARLAGELEELTFAAGRVIVREGDAPDGFYVYFASEGELFSHAQARRPLVLEAVYRLVALQASVPVWQLTGMM